MEDQPMQGKKSNKTLLIVIVIVVVIGAAAAIYFFTQSKETTNTATESSTTETNTTTSTNTVSETRYQGDDFSILNPADWTQSQISGTLVSFHNTSEVHPEGSAAKKINFQSYLAVSFDMTNERSLVETNDLTINQIKAAIPSAEVTASSDETVDGQPAKFSVFTMSQQEVDYTVFLAVILNGDKYFIISGNTTTDKWTEYKDMFYQTARSFTME